MGHERNIEVIARALMVHEGHVLLCWNVEGGYAFLPGGHVEFGEPAQEALERELVEELGMEARAGDLVMVAEQMFEVGRKTHHEVLLVFHTPPPPPPPPPQHSPPTGPGSDAGVRGLPVVESREPEIRFEWVDLAVVLDLDIRPASTKAFLASGGVERAAGDEGASNGANPVVWVAARES